MRAAGWRGSAATAALATSALAAGLLLAGCTAFGPGPSPTAAAPSPSASASKAPKLYPNGTAAINRAYFDQVNEALIAKKAFPGSKAVVANLVKAGFDESLIEYTPDKTAIGLDAEAIYFSVRFDDQCLIGEIGRSFGYHSLKADVVDGGTCLYGLTEKP